MGVMLLCPQNRGHETAHPKPLVMSIFRRKKYSLGSKERNSLCFYQAGTFQSKAGILCILPSPAPPPCKGYFVPEGKSTLHLGQEGVTLCSPTALCLLDNCKTLSLAAAPRSSERDRTCWKADAYVGAGPARTFQAVTQPHSCSARTLPTLPRHSPTQPGPAVSRHWAGVAVFLLYQDLAEIGGEWVMFVQRFVQANGYVSAQGYSGGSAGCASPAHVRGCRATRPVVVGDSRTHSPALRGVLSVSQLVTKVRSVCLSCRDAQCYQAACQGAGGRDMHSGSAVRMLQQPCLPCTGSRRDAALAAAKTPAPAPVTQLLKVAG